MRAGRAPLPGPHGGALGGASLAVCAGQRPLLLGEAPLRGIFWSDLKDKADKEMTGEYIYRPWNPILRQAGQMLEWHAATQHRTTQTDIQTI